MQDARDKRNDSEARGGDVTGNVIVLGIDPGSIVTGFGVVALENGRMRVVSSGVTRTSSGKPLPERLRDIHSEVIRQIDVHHPDIVVVEDIFYAKNVKSVLKLGHARGVILLAAAQSGLPVHEYAPRAVKQSVVGSGAATKDQVASMVSRLLGLEHGTMVADETDALAVAVCHIHRMSGASVR